MSTDGVVDIKARQGLHLHAMAMFGAVRSILEDTDRHDAREAQITLSEIEGDPASGGSALAWEVWHRLNAEYPPLVNKGGMESEFHRGVIGPQLHHWIEVHAAGERYVIDVSPPDVYSGPILVGPRSPLLLLYG